MTSNPTQEKRASVRSGIEFLLLGTAISSRVLDIADALVKNNPDASIVVAVPEVEAWKFTDCGYEVVVQGEEQLLAACTEMRSLIAKRNFQEIVLPVGIPRGPLFAPVRLVSMMPDEQFVVDAGVRLKWRPAIFSVLILVTLLAWFPLSLMDRLLRALDGLGVLLGGMLARTRRRRPAGESGGDVCHVVPDMGTGGTQRQVVEYLRRVGPGSPTRLIALFDSGDRFLRELEGTAVEPIILARECRRNQIGRLAVRFLPNTMALIALFSFFRAVRPGCVMSWLFQANVVAAPAARLAGVPRVVSSVRNMSSWKSWPGFRRWWYWPADRLAVPLNDVIFANSRAAADDFVRWTGRSDLQVEVVPNGLDIEGLLAAPYADIRKRHGLSREASILLTVGRLAAEKDHETLLEACSRLATPSRRWHLLVAGHGVLESRLRQLVDELGLQSQVTFTGRVDDPESYYRAATLFVLSSRIEGLPNALIEAQVFGLAAVTTDCGGAGDVVIDGLTGRVVPVGNIGALAQNIDELLQDEETRSSMGRAAADISLQKFNVPAMVEAIDELSGRKKEARVEVR